MWSARQSGNSARSSPRSAKAVALYANSRDTIFALASAAGKSAVAIFRISGPACAAVLAALAPKARFPVRQVVLGTLRHPGTREPIDRALITRFEAPSSFTGEDLVEIGVTGGRAVVSATVKALMLVPGLRRSPVSSPGAPLSMARSICRRSKASRTSSTPKPRLSGGRRSELRAARSVVSARRFAHC